MRPNPHVSTVLSLSEIVWAMPFSLDDYLFYIALFIPLKELLASVVQAVDFQLALWGCYQRHIQMEAWFSSTDLIGIYRAGVHDMCMLERG